MRAAGPLCLLTRPECRSGFVLIFGLGPLGFQGFGDFVEGGLRAGFIYRQVFLLRKEFLDCPAGSKLGISLGLLASAANISS